MRDRNAFRYIAEDPIVLDLTGCRYGGEVHERIKEAFGFPDYYGKNWDAMWDCIDFLFDQQEIVIRGFQTMPKDVREYCRPMLEIFEDLHEKNPKITYRMK